MSKDGIIIGVAADMGHDGTLTTERLEQWTASETSPTLNIARRTPTRAARPPWDAKRGAVTSDMPRRQNLKKTAIGVAAWNDSYVMSTILPAWASTIGCREI